jgi:ATP-dependent RNA helicase RhlE
VLERSRIPSARIHGNRSQSQRTEALEGFKAGRYRVLVATDIAARGIDVEALSHVINFDVPQVPEDYVHRVGRTARAEATGDAFTFVAPDEHGLLQAIERAIGKALPRVTLPGFDYTTRPTERLEIPLQERLRAMRAQKTAGRANAAAKGRPQPPRTSGGGPPETPNRGGPGPGGRSRTRRFGPSR